MELRNRSLSSAALVGWVVLSSASARSPRDNLSVSFDATIVNSSALSEPVGPNSRGSATLRAQILLDRANFSPGQIDGHYGKNMRAAISAFQKSRSLPENGLVDAETWRI